MLLTGLGPLSVPGPIGLTDVYAVALSLFGLADIGHGFVSIALFALLADLPPARFSRRRAGHGDRRAARPDRFRSRIAAIREKARR